MVSPTTADVLRLATRILRNPAESSAMHLVAAEVANATDGGGLNGQDMSESLSRIEALMPAEVTALIECLEHRHAGAA
ncbi:hypothetical protein PP715_23335 [Ralstonia solanacearum]|uniref:hypothetical protein n=1 Tax=Ralstonia solanacearum TaxID=305 RepID=UPI0005AC1810|nr:hypothetical protein [Ralstonia solanacearum]AMP72626.1 hypothetical protein UW163_24135 [Ralstonia solanacearum]MCL9842428.1 hypothetical protein [Ralstonia solanacearum]MDB0534524.1 hypothetical protein [Ralstonia solanacearum]MDB0539320.1 hypothetical protein [Ralstonia solanacearum]MDB0549126.1 hypothetical protein [Ralstonia solanacearum]